MGRAELLRILSHLARHAFGLGNKRGEYWVETPELSLVKEPVPVWMAEILGRNSFTEPPTIGFAGLCHYRYYLI